MMNHHLSGSVGREPSEAFKHYDVLIEPWKFAYQLRIVVRNFRYPQVPRICLWFDAWNKFSKISSQIVGLMIFLPWLGSTKIIKQTNPRSQSPFPFDNSPSVLNSQNASDKPSQDENNKRTPKHPGT